MSTVADYVGRIYDLLALRGAQPTGETRLQQSLFGRTSAGEICTGIQKLAQRWVLEFLTETGTLLFDPTRGCDFMTVVRAGLLRTEADVLTQFRFAQIDITRNLQAEESSTTAIDEQFASATLTSVELLPGYMQLYVTVLSQAGSSRSVIMPISTLP